MRRPEMLVEDLAERIAAAGQQQRSQSPPAA
jgi:hypothetical protein